VKWIVPIMGFRESVSRPTGIERVWRDVRGFADAGLCVITPYEWWEDMRGLAQFIVRNSAVSPRVMVIAYSWGCGAAFATLARECEAMGVEITVAVLCDPVFRSRVFPAWLPLNPLSVSPWMRPAIKIPASVQRVEWVRQDKDFPRGHDLVAEDPASTVIGLGCYVPVGHTRIDNSTEFQSLALREANIFARD